MNRPRLDQVSNDKDRSYAGPFNSYENSESYHEKKFISKYVLIEKKKKNQFRDFSFVLWHRRTGEKIQDTADVRVHTFYAGTSFFPFFFKAISKKNAIKFIFLSIR